MALCVGRFSSLLVLLGAAVLAGMLPTACLAAGHGNHTEDDHDHIKKTMNHTEDDHDHINKTMKDGHDDDHDHMNKTVKDDHHDDRDHMNKTVEDGHDHKNETAGDDHEKGTKHDHDHDDDHEKEADDSHKNHTDHDHGDHDHDDHKDKMGGDEHENETKPRNEHKNETTHDHDHNHDHDDDHRKETRDNHTNHTKKDDGHDHDHDHDHEKDDHSNHTSSGTDAHDEDVIYGEFKVVVAEDQESMLKDAKVIEAFEKAYASFTGVADSAVHVKFLDNVDHSGHNHRRLQQAQHEQDGEYEIKTKGLTNATVQAAVKKLQLAKDTTSKANELKTAINREIQTVSGFTTLRIQSVALLTSPVVKEATTSTQTETAADFAKQASCPWMHYSLFAAAVLVKSLI